ncbi:MAG TPA: LysM peptidoglycan-binding domain-containing protein [Smithellaceae bacterium]|nr:LysM peptidoglycan-binding domain-containing protein [Smithellaceae bacterium]
MENTVTKSYIYTIQRGDTLTKIAKAHNTTPAELARINNLTHIDIIKVGQRLIIRPFTPPTPEKNPEETDTAGHLFLKFVDSLEKPIAKLKVWVQAGAEVFEHITDARGEIPVMEIGKPDTPVTVQVQKAAGGKKTVSTFTADAGKNTSVLLSAPNYWSGQASGRMKASRPKNGQPPKIPLWKWARLFRRARKTAILWCRWFWNAPTMRISGWGRSTASTGR